MPGALKMSGLIEEGSERGGGVFCCDWSKIDWSKLRKMKSEINSKYPTKVRTNFVSFHNSLGLSYDHAWLKIRGGVGGTG